MLKRANISCEDVVELVEASSVEEANLWLDNGWHLLKILKLKGEVVYILGQGIENLPKPAPVPIPDELRDIITR